MVGDAHAAVRFAARLQAHVAQEFGDVAHAGTDGVGLFVVQLEAVVAHDGAAAGCRGDDGVEGLIGFLLGDIVDERFGVAMRFGRLAEVVIQRAAAAGAFDRS